MKYRDNYVNKRRFLDEIILSGRIPAKEELVKMYRMEKDKNPVIRWSMAKALVNRYAPESEKVLRRMACDKNRMVRVEALDSLRIGREEETLWFLKEKMGNASGRMERGYAAGSYFDVWVNCYGYHRESMRKYLESIEEFYKKEDNLWVSVSYERNRYLAGEKDALENLVATLADESIEDYHVRYAVLNILREIKNTFCMDGIKNVLKRYFPDVEAESQVLREGIEEILTKPAIISVLFLDGRNEGSSQFLEGMTRFDEGDFGILYESAGIIPTEKIKAELVNLMKKEKDFDIEEEQYPKPILHVWSYDFLVPVGIKLKPEDYPFQRIVPLFEDVDENMLDVEQAKRMIEELRDYIYKEIQHAK